MRMAVLRRRTEGIHTRKAASMPSMLTVQPDYNKLAGLVGMTNPKSVSINSSIILGHMLTLLRPPMPGPQSRRSSPLRPPLLRAEEETPAKQQPPSQRPVPRRSVVAKPPPQKMMTRTEARLLLQLRLVFRISTKSWVALTSAENQRQKGKGDHSGCCRG